MLLFALFLWALATPAPSVRGQDAIEEDVGYSVVTPEILKSKIAEVEADSELSEESRGVLTEWYRQTLSHLEKAKANRERAATFEEVARSAPEQTESVRAELEVRRQIPHLAGLLPGPESTLEDLDQQLLQEEAELASATAQWEELERRIVEEAGRPAAIRLRLESGSTQQEDIASALETASNPEEMPDQVQAKRWVFEAQSQVLSTEVQMLNQELESRTVRLDRLLASRDLAALQIERAGARVEVLAAHVQEQRQREAEAARTNAEISRRQTEGLDPVLTRLADQNAELTEDLNSIAGRLDALRREKENTARLAARIAADQQDAKETLEASGLTAGLGDVLLASKQFVPNVKACRRAVRAREMEMAEAKVRQLHHREESRRIADVEETVLTLLAQFTTRETPELKDQLTRLVERRQELLHRALETDGIYLNQLGEALASEQQLAVVSKSYGEFLNENLLWLGNMNPMRPSDLRTVPAEVRTVLSLETWSGLIDVFLHRVGRAPWFLGVLLAAGILRWKRPGMREAMGRKSSQVGHPRCDLFTHTAWVLLWTILLAAPLPMVVAAVGGLLLGGTIGNDPSLVVGAALIRVALHLFVLQFWYRVCEPSGLAIKHFRWPSPRVGQLRVELRHLIWVFVPAILFGNLAVDLNPVQRGGTTARLFLLMAYGILAWFVFRILHPRTGVLAIQPSGDQRTFLNRTYRLWFLLLLALPVGSIVLTLAGYMYSLATLSQMFLRTAWLLASLVLLRALSLRWLLVVRRRMMFEAAVERRRAAQVARQSGPPAEEDVETGILHAEEPEVDLTALSEDTWELVRLVVIIIGLIGLFMIWSPALPALHFLDDVRLPYLHVSLSALGLALAIAVGTGVLARRLPALLEIILLRRFDLPGGSRYAVTTLFNYAIVLTGTLVALGLLGIKWSQLQWLVAALGVGIGFGLQEIVANFISGLIILFERPVRVGDIVTVGTTEGVVTRIRIRATTIRNWDRKELLVPNKEFITGQVLNWSLSDQVLRIVITVGVAYGTDIQHAFALMKEAALEHENVLDDPDPILSFEGFGDNSLNLILRIYVGSIEHRLATTTDLHMAIDHKFNQAGIVIAFPQRDVHLDLHESLRARTEPVEPTGSVEDDVRTIDDPGWVSSQTDT